MMELPLADQFEEANFVPNPVGPSSRGCFRVSNGNVCGSGSLLAKRNGKSLGISNAHVCGTKIGHTVVCTFPFLNNKQVRAKVIMAAYSDRVMMDWVILEIEEEIDLPHSKLDNTVPNGQHYTAGYPRCRGPYFQELTTREITHGGTVWKWSPNSIGGQSGSGVHSVSGNLQRGLLTWSWSGFGAGQTARGIWFQYANRAEIGFAKPPDLIELNDNRAEDLEEGFFQQTDITTLPIWAHLDDIEPPPDEPPNGGGCPELAALLQAEASELQKRATRLAELARKYAGESNGDDGGDKDKDDTGPLFGL